MPTPVDITASASNAANDASLPAPRTDASASDSMVPVINPSTGQMGHVPSANLAKARTLGFEPRMGKIEAGLRGGGQGVTLGFGDELEGAAHAAVAGGKALVSGGHPIDAAHDEYIRARDEARQRLADAHDQHAGYYNAGELAGGIPTALAIPGGLAGAVAGGAVAGAGHSDASDVGDLAKDTAIGAGVGAVGHGIGSAIGAGARGLASGTRGAIGSNVLEHAGVKASDFDGGARELAEHATRISHEPSLVPSAAQGVHPQEHLATASEAARKAAGSKLDSLYSQFDSQFGPSVGVKDLASAMETHTADAVKNDPAFRVHLQQAVRLLHPESFDAAVSHADAGLDNAIAQLKAVKRSGGRPAAIESASQRVAEAKARVALLHTSPSSAYHPDHKLTLREAQDVLNALRSRGGAPSGGIELSDVANARKSVYKPAWKSAREGLGQAVASHDPAAAAPIQAARQQYGQSAALADAAQSALRRGDSPQMGNLGKAAVQAAGAGIGGAVGGFGGAGAGAVAARAAEPAIAKVVAPRVAPTLQAVAPKLEQVAASPTAAKVGDTFERTFGRFFAGKSPEHKAVIDARLQDLLPNYRKARQEAQKEHHANQKHADTHAQVNHIGDTQPGDPNSTLSSHEDYLKGIK